MTRAWLGHMLFEVILADDRKLEYPDRVTFQFETGAYWSSTAPETTRSGTSCTSPRPSGRGFRSVIPGARTDVHP